jgi:tetratricopeptide (TPR) repeat protein
LHKEAKRCAIKGRLEEAQTLEARALEVDPGNLNALSGLGALHEAQGRPEEAQQLWMRLLEVSPGDIVALFALGSSYHKNGRLEEAQRMYERVLEINSQHLETLENFGKLHYDHYRLEEARPLLERALQLDPYSVTALFKLGSLHHDQQRPDDALPLLRRAVEKDPQHFNALGMLGTVHQEQQRPDEAIRIWEQALAIDPGHVHTLVSLGREYFEQGQPEKALPLLERAVKIGPVNAEMLSNLAMLYNRLAQPDKAQQRWEQALELNQEHIAALVGLGGLHYDHYRLEEARKLWERVILLDPRDVLTLRNLGLLHHKQGRLEASRQLNKLALNIEQESEPELEVARFEDLVGAVVQLHGLSQRPELNGRRGVVRSFDAGRARCAWLPCSFRMPRHAGFMFESMFFGTRVVSRYRVEVDGVSMRLRPGSLTAVDEVATAESDAPDRVPLTGERVGTEYYDSNLLSSGNTLQERVLAACQIVELERRSEPEPELEPVAELQPEPELEPEPDSVAKPDVAMLIEQQLDRLTEGDDSYDGVLCIEVALFRAKLGMADYETVAFPTLFFTGRGHFDEYPSVRFKTYRRRCMQYYDGRFAGHHIWSGWAASMEEYLRDALVAQLAAECDVSNVMSHLAELHATGSVVAIGGLVQRPELNGRTGVVRSFDAAAGRCAATFYSPVTLLVQ